jgi:hypothetical protein
MRSGSATAVRSKTNHCGARVFKRITNEGSYRPFVFDDQDTVAA